MSSSRSAPEARLEEVDRTSDLQYRAVFEAAADGVLICTVEGCIVEVNPAFCSMHGYTRDELIGRQLATLLPRDATITTGQESRTESVHLRRDGSEFPVS
jgi:PAS domain S-box-containing protein